MSTHIIILDINSKLVRVTTIMQKEISDAHPGLLRDLNFNPVVNKNPKALNRKQIQCYNNKGYIFPIEVFSETEISIHRKYFNWIIETEIQNERGGYSINGWHCHDPHIYDLIVDNRILDYVGDLLGENIICWGTHYFCKLPGDSKQISFHQDASYWPLTPSKTVTVWLAIDDTDIENSAMKLIPKSHLYGQINYQHSTPEEQNVLNQTVDSPENYGGSPVYVELKSGQISLHSDLILHGSDPNLSNRRRCGLTMRFAPPEVKTYHGWNRNAVICRGTDSTNHWINNPRPSKSE
ncbi:TPA: phytanoyl-CoA dioxygenase family protein [Candidatus Poribacteria bacterium]|nr:phytanoyl-CoA dioxygenase family protein [Candidatus Poribacteria bacterium]HIO80431.1 phytanoyl-CoA dioxygenase family protein [Candidatus Poribacteria bacterium]